MSTNKLTRALNKVPYVELTTLSAELLSLSELALGVISMNIPKVIIYTATSIIVPIYLPKFIKAGDKHEHNSSNK